MPRNCWPCVSVLGTGHDWTASVFSGSYAIPSQLTMCPRYFMDFRNQAHLLTISFRLVAFSLCTTHLKLPRISLSFAKNDIIHLNQAFLQLQTPQYSAHEPLEHRWSPWEPECLTKMKQTLAGLACSFGIILIFHFHLPVPGGEV